MLAIDNIKIKYSQEGYLQNYPPHLISDEEMCNAFLTNPISYFTNIYPFLGEKYESDGETYTDFYKAYLKLINAFKYHICRFLSSVDSFKVDLPNWVYSYMLGSVVNSTSPQEDRHYILVGLNCDNIDDILTVEYQLACYKLSQRWVNKLDKSLKVANLDTLLKDYTDNEKDIIMSEFNQWDVSFDDNNDILFRPPSMYGEQNIIKLIRLGQVG